VPVVLECLIGREVAICEDLISGGDRLTRSQSLARLCSEAQWINGLEIWISDLTRPTMLRQLGFRPRSP
jgi:hypothetical protein